MRSMHDRRRVGAAHLALLLAAVSSAAAADAPPLVLEHLTTDGRAAAGDRDDDPAGLAGLRLARHRRRPRALRRRTSCIATRARARKRLAARQLRLAVAEDAHARPVDRDERRRRREMGSPHATRSRAIGTIRATRARLRATGCARCSSMRAGASGSARSMPASTCSTRLGSNRAPASRPGRSRLARRRSRFRAVRSIAPATSGSARIAGLNRWSPRRARWLASAPRVTRTL